MSKKVISISIDEEYLEMLDFCREISAPSRSSMIELAIQNQFLMQLTHVYLPCREEHCLDRDLLAVAMKLYSSYRSHKLSIDQFRDALNDFSDYFVQ